MNPNDEMYYLNGPDEFVNPNESTSAPVEKKKNKTIPLERAWKYVQEIHNLEDENARLRSLIDIAFDTGRKGPYPTKEQFKKDNNL
jgi:hypothetical protein